MSKFTAMRRRASTSRVAGKAFRCCAALLLGLQIIYTPIHVFLEPHSEAADARSNGVRVRAAAVMEDRGHDADGHHDRHSAAEHQLKALRTQRTPVPEMMTIPAVEAVASEGDGRRSRVFEFSGLSPPELSRCWQFFLRAALPVRAPSLLS